MTKTSKNDNACYLQMDWSADRKNSEVRLSKFNHKVHSYLPSENEIQRSYFESELSCMGPLLVRQSATDTVLLGYEHASEYPNAFLNFELSDTSVAVDAVKGNYYSGQLLNEEEGFETIWFQFGRLKGGIDDIRRAYRTFVLEDLSEHTASRKPYIYYNTCNQQELDRNWRSKPYLASMYQESTLAEIDAAYRLGIDVFVIDTGWYRKTGDCEANLERFHDNLKSVRVRLDRYGMKLGLWLNPDVAKSSQLGIDHEDCIQTKDGERWGPLPLWETEESYPLCFVSRFGDAFADKLIQMITELGVTYLKWDAINNTGATTLIIFMRPRQTVQKNEQSAMLLTKFDR